MGSKSKIGKRIIGAILDDLKDLNVNPKECAYIEPFVGALGSMSKTDGLFAERHGFDTNPYLFSLWIAMQKFNYIPPDIVSIKEYQEIKNNKEFYEPRLVGFVGFGCSFGGKWFGGYAKDKGGRNYAQEAQKSCIEKIAKCKDVLFSTFSYDSSHRQSDFGIPKVFYCDPPYQNTVKYTANEEIFDYDKFWQWCIDRTKEGSLVYVSEYSVPEKFSTNVKEILRFVRSNTLRSSDLGGKKDVEKLFKVMG